MQEVGSVQQKGVSQEKIKLCERLRAECGYGLLLVMYLRLYRGKMIVVWSQPFSLGFSDGCNHGTNRRRKLTLVTPRWLIVALRIEASE